MFMGRGAPSAVASLSSPIEDRTVVTTPDAMAWRVYLPVGLEGTVKDDAGPMMLDQLELRFAFTRDEEHVELTVRTPEASNALKTRAHYYPLLLLARQRLADQRAGHLPPNRAGPTSRTCSRC
jgi:hypothetical protein